MFFFSFEWIDYFLIEDETEKEQCSGWNLYLGFTKVRELDDVLWLDVNGGYCSAWQSPLDTGRRVLFEKVRTRGAIA